MICFSPRDINNLLESLSKMVHLFGEVSHLFHHTSHVIALVRFGFAIHAVCKVNDLAPSMR